MPNDSGLKRYNLVLPATLFDELQKLADSQHTTVVELIRRFVKLGIVVTTLVTDDPDAALIVRSGESERELVII